ncbi:MAG TPA: hypothetical protein PK239_08435 [Chitinophagales bacterium]|nr:hypothetical protein [Chitinophagales bacterium]
MPAGTPKILTLLQTFSPDEMQRFDELVRSPFFNKKTAVVALLQAIQPYYPHFEAWNPQVVFSAVFGEGKPYNDKYFNNLLSDLWMLAKQFLVQSDLQLRPIEQQYFIAEELAMRNLLAHAERELKALDAMLNEQKYTHTDYYELRVKYNRIADYLLYKQQHITRRNHALQQKLDGLLHYYWYYTFKLCAVMSGLQTTSTSFRFNLSKVVPILRTFNPDDYPAEPHLTVAYYMMRLNEPDAQWFEFEHLLQLTQEQREVFSADLIKMITIFLANYLSRLNLVNPLSATQMQIWFLLYEQLIQLHQQQKDTMPTWLFDAAVRVGLTVMGADWADEFVKTNQNRLLPSFAEQYIPYANACICFTQANYADAIYLLSAISPQHTSFYFKIKMLLLMAYYHTQNYDAYLLTSDTVKHTLRSRTEISTAEQQYLKNAIGAMDKLYKLHLKFAAAAYEKLSLQIFDNTTPIAHKQWLQNQLLLVAKKQHRIKLKQAPFFE